VGKRVDIQSGFCLMMLVHAVLSTAREHMGEHSRCTAQMLVQPCALTLTWSLLSWQIFIQWNELRFWGGTQQLFNGTQRCSATL